MSTIALGHGSEWHLLRYLGYHRNELNRVVENETGTHDIRWLDFLFDARHKFLDAEWKGVDFLGPEHPAATAWRNYWPSSGNVQNWDAIGQARCAEEDQWLLVEAKGNLREIETACGAKEHGGLPKIRQAFERTQLAMGIPPSVDSWLAPYYQYANRLAALSFLLEQGISARLLFVYFLGDNTSFVSCPRTTSAWSERLDLVRTHLGLTGKSKLEGHVHHLFLPVCEPIVIANREVA